MNACLVIFRRSFFFDLTLYSYLLFLSGDSLHNVSRDPTLDPLLLEHETKKLDDSFNSSMRAHSPPTSLSPRRLNSSRHRSSSPVRLGTPSKTSTPTARKCFPLCIKLAYFFLIFISSNFFALFTLICFFLRFTRSSCLWRWCLWSYIGENSVQNNSIFVLKIFEFKQETSSIIENSLFWWCYAIPWCLSLLYTSIHCLEWSNILATLVILFSSVNISA